MRHAEAKAKARVLRKIARAMPCPFCGGTPQFRAYVDAESQRGSIGHYAVRLGCCAATKSGQTELFFCNDGKPADYKLWASMVSRLVDDWNRRAPQ